MIGNVPSPCPTLCEGLAIGANEHRGFINVWNWIVDIFRNVKDNLVIGINGRQGDISIVAGSGIDVVASGNTITIGLGSGNSVDEDNQDDTSENGGGAEDQGEIWQNAEPSETSGGELSYNGGMFAWDSSSATIGPGGVMIGRQWVNAGGTGSGKDDGLYQVVCTVDSSGSYSCQVVSGVSLGQAPTSTQCWIPIYEISEGKIATDYRGAFVVPAFD